MQALILEQQDGKTLAAVKAVDDSLLPQGNVTVDIQWSSLNYKDALAITGKGKIIRNFPMVPGIDFAGTVHHSDDPRFTTGQQVLLTGWGVGENHWGGLSERARVNGDWLVPLPAGLDGRKAMIIGTAGFTAMLCVMALEDAGVRWLEPAWKSIISNKALLPLLWEMFPDHPNLLPAYFAEDDHPQMDKFVVKPIFSREGANISIVENGKTIEQVEGPYGEEGMIVQQFHPLPKFGDSYMLIGSWLINDQPAGIGIREDRALITQDLSRFYPHIFVE